MKINRIMRSTGIRFFVFIICISTLSACAQQQSNLTNKEKSDIIDKSSKLLNDKYIFSDVALKVEKHLKSQLGSGVFDTITTTIEFAKRLTIEMQSISKDKHMRCISKSGRAKSGPTRKVPVFHDYEKLSNEKNLDFIRAGMLDNNIGVVEILNFPGSSRAKSSVDEAMSAISSSKALIIDLRRNNGGDPSLVRYICSYFFDKPTHINSIYWRSRNRTADLITLETVPGKKMVNTPILILTSSYTISGGEELAYDIQTQKRGIIIGDVTGGGANPGDKYSLNKDLKLFVPTGMAINPITKTNWEGVGVKPDFEVEASKAFEVALGKIEKDN